MPKPARPAVTPVPPQPAPRPGPAAEPIVRKRVAALAAATLLALAAMPLSAQVAGRFNVVINEVASRSAIGGDRAVELYNYGPAQVMTGWRLTYYSGANSNQYTFPTFTLPRHGFVVVHWAAGTDGAGDLYTGAALPFSLGATGQLLLTNGPSAIGGEDYLCWSGGTGCDTNPNIAAPLTWTGALTWPSGSGKPVRQRDLNTRSSDDWTLNTLPFDSLGGLNGGQTGSRRHGRLLINEFRQRSALTGGGAPWVEIYNPHPFTVNTGDGEIDVFDDGTTTPCLTIALPASLTAGQILSYDIPTANCTLFNTSGALDGEIRVGNGAFEGWDYAVFNQATTPNLAANQRWTGGPLSTVSGTSATVTRRLNDLDSDNADDWATVTTVGTRDALNPGQSGPAAYYETGGESLTQTVSDADGGSRGNQLLMTRGIFLRQLTTRINLTAAPRDVTHAVLKETTPGSGTWSAVYQGGTATISAVDDGSFRSAPALALQPGERYLVSTYVSNTYSYYREALAEPFPYATVEGARADVNYLPGGGTISLGSLVAFAADQHYAYDLGPQITTVSLAAGEVGLAYSQTPAFSAGTGTHVWSATGLPSGLAIAAATGAITGTPTTAGSYPVVVTVTDGNGVYSRLSTTITVYAQLTITTTALPDGEQGIAYSQALASSGGGGAITWSVSAGALPAGLTLSSGGAITGTPTATGTANFTARAQDALGAVATKALSITIADPIAVVTGSVLPDGSVGIAYAQTLVSSGGTGGQSWSVIAGALPGGLALSAAGGISGTPSVPGPFTFTARVTDSAGGSASRQFWIYVEAAFSIRNAALGTGYLKTAYAETLVADGGTPAYTYSVVSGSLPPGISLSGASGSLSGTPTQAGVYPVTFGASDAAARSTTRALTITVLQQPDIPDWRRRGLFGGNIEEVDVSPSFAADGTVFVRGRELELFRHRAADLDAEGNWRWTMQPIDPTHLYTDISDVVLSPVYNQNSAATPEVQTVFVATDYGAGSAQVYKSVDHGETFTPAVTGSVAGCARASALAVSPGYAGDHTLWLAQLCTSPANRLAIQKSTDGGASWSEAADLASIYVNPYYTADALAAATPSILFLSYHGSLYRSLDGGATWSGPLLTPPSAIDMIAVSPNFASDATLWAHSGTTVYRSRNRGESFQTLPTAAVGYPRSISVSSRAGTSPLWLAYYATGAEGSTPVLRASTDGGDSFVSLGGFGARGGFESRAWATPQAAGSPPVFLVSSVFGVDLRRANEAGFDAQDGGLTAIDFLGMCTTGVYMIGASRDAWLISGDSGNSWNYIARDSADLPQSLGESCAISANYANDGVLFMESGGDLYRTADGGQSWSRVLDETDIEEIALQPGFSGAAGSVKKKLWVAGRTTLYRSDDAGLTFTPVAIPGACGTPGSAGWIKGLAYSPQYGNGDSTLFAGSALAVCKSLDDGANWSALGGANAPNFATHIALSPGYDERNATKKLIATGSGGTRYSTNGGASWGVSSGAYTSFDRAYASPSFALDGTAYFITASTTTDGRAGLYRTTDQGLQIDRVPFPPDQLAGRKVVGFGTGIAFNSGSGTSVAIAVTGGSGIFRSTDSAATFAPHSAVTTVATLATCAAAVPDDAVIADTDRLRAGTILFGTEYTGVYRSNDGGSTFRWFSRGLPFWVATRALHVPRDAPDAPLAAMAGKGIWRFDNTDNTWKKVDGGVGTFTAFTEDATYVYASRADGRSQRSADDGLTWSLVSPGETDLVGIHDASDPNPFRSPLRGVSGPRQVSGTTASLWAVSAAAGPRFSTDSGSSWTAAPGGNDYVVTPGQTWQVTQALGLDATSGARQVLSGSATALWLTRDGGDSWRRADGPGSGLELSSKNFSSVMTATTAYGNTDVLVGVNGTTTGGVYLSGDGGEHWTIINQGFDSSNLSISSLVKTSCTGCPVQYYSGSYGSGVYTRTITVNAPPAFSVNYGCWGSTGCACGAVAGSGTTAGGQAFKLCGTGFLAGMVVEYDGVQASGCVLGGSTVITCTATPAHAAGYATIRVRNTDTRAASLSVPYQYSGGASRTVNSLRVAKSGADAGLAWSCAGCSAGAPARIWRAQNAVFSLYVENYDGGTGTAYTNTGAVASAQNYFWSVE